MELQYDGTGLHGWAKQEGLSTVEGCLEDALRTVLGSGAGPAGGRADRRGRACPAAGGEPAAARGDRSAQADGLAERADPAGHRRSRRIARAPEGFDARKDAVQPHLPVLPVDSAGASVLARSGPGTAGRRGADA